MAILGNLFIIFSFGLVMTGVVYLGIVEAREMERKRREHPVRKESAANS